MSDRERYIEVQMHGLDCKASWVRDDARQIGRYARSLAVTRSEDGDMRDKVRGSLSAAVLAIREALLAVRVAEQEFDAAIKPKLPQAAE